MVLLVYREILSMPGHRTRLTLCSGREVLAFEIRILTIYGKLELVEVLLIVDAAESRKCTAKHSGS